MTLTIELPLPPRECSSNRSHDHWRGRAAAAREYREVCRWLAYQAAQDAKWQAPLHATISLEFGVKGSRREGRYAPRDEANAIASFKAGQDGLCDAGVLLSDRAGHLAQGRIHIDSKQGPWVRVVLTGGES